jgi:hypothetical protein
MNRRTFLRWIGLGALVPSVVARAITKPDPIVANTGLSLEKLRECSLLLDSNEVPEDRWFALSKKQVSRIHSEDFTLRLEEEGKLAFTEQVYVMPARAHCVQVYHNHAGKLDRLHWIDAGDYGPEMLDKVRADARLALRRYWARDIRTKRKLEAARARREQTAVHVGDGKFEWRDAFPI